MSGRFHSLHKMASPEDNNVTVQSNIVVNIAFTLRWHVACGTPCAMCYLKTNIWSLSYKSGVANYICQVRPTCQAKIGLAHFFHCAICHLRQCCQILSKKQCDVCLLLCTTIPLSDNEPIQHLHIMWGRTNICLIHHRSTIRYSRWQNY